MLNDVTDQPKHAVLQLSDGTLICTLEETRPVEPYHEVLVGTLAECELWLGHTRSGFLHNEALIARMREQRPRPEMARRIAFLKLLKTGGTSFASCVLFPYCVKHSLPYMVPVSFPGWGITPANVGAGAPTAEFQMLFRHFPDYPLRRSWLEERLGRPTKVTIVRDPVQRAMSMYRHQRRHEGYSHSFGQYLETNHSGNHQSSWLGFTGSRESLNGIEVVGVSERFNESMLLFARALRMEVHDFLYVRQRDLSSESVEVKDSDVERIRAVDALDLQLHQLATIELEKSLRGLPGIADDLAEYEDALRNLEHPLWRRRGPFKIGYAEGREWAEVTADGEYRQLVELGG